MRKNIILSIISVILLFSSQSVLVAQIEPEQDMFALRGSPRMMVTTINDGNDIIVWDQRYNRSGNLTATMLYNSNEELINGTRYIYNDAGLLYQTRFINSAHSCYDSITYAYNKQDECMVQTRKSARRNAPHCSYEKHYNKNKELIALWLITPDNRQRNLMQTTRYLHNPNGLIDEQIEQYADGSQRTILYRFTDIKKRELEIFQEVGNQITLLERITFTKEGYPRTLTQYYTNGETSVRYHYNKYDSHGNWLEMRQTLYYGEDKQNKDITRTIVYYQ